MASECKHKRRIVFVNGATGLNPCFETTGPKTVTPWKRRYTHAWWCVECGRLKTGSEEWRTPSVLRAKEKTDG